jgi:hypothetical protein
MIIRTKHELRKTWEICPTAIRLPAVLYYYSHNYWENIVNDYRLKLCILIEVDDLLTTGSSFFLSGKINSSDLYVSARNQ